MVNFNIIEGTNDTDTFNEFKQYYSQPDKYSMKYIRNHLDIGGTHCNNLVQRFIEEEGKVRSGGRQSNLVPKTNNSKFYSKTGDGKYVVTKQVGLRRVYFGTYRTETDARYVVEQLKNNEWKFNNEMDSEDNYPQFKKLYRDNASLENITKALKINIPQYREYVAKFNREKWITEVRGAKSNYYIKNKWGKYIIQKSNENSNPYFKTVNTKEEAKWFVNELKKVGWDKSKLPEIERRFNDEF